MKKTFKLNNGEIVIDNDRLLISDDSTKQKRKRLITSSLWIFFGALSVLRYLKEEDQFLLWSGLIIGIGHIIVIVFTLLKTDREELLLSEIKSIKEQKFISNRFLDLRLKNNLTRRITPNNNTKDILESLETYMVNK